MMRLALLVGALWAAVSAPISPPRASGEGPMCIALPFLPPELGEHGQLRWRDDRVLVSDPTREWIRIPGGWLPVGAIEMAGGCARFPPDQSAVFIRPQYWDVQILPGIVEGVKLELLYPRGTSARQLARWRRLVGETFDKVADLFPLGLLPDQRSPFVVMVTFPLAGAGRSPQTRLFPAPGPTMTPLAYPSRSPRGREVFIRAAVRFFNRDRARPEVRPQQAGLPAEAYAAMVAGWAGLALHPSGDYARRRLDFLHRQHRRLLDGDPRTWPDAPPLRGLARTGAAPGLLLDDAETEGPAKVFAQEYLAPLVMFAIEGLLSRQGSPRGLADLLRDIHGGRSQGLLASLDPYLHGRLDLIRAWIRGEALVPLQLAREGLARSRQLESSR